VTKRAGDFHCPSFSTKGDESDRKWQGASNAAASAGVGARGGDSRRALAVGTLAVRASARAPTKMEMRRGRAKVEVGLMGTTDR
jgi:hypothetical protein